MFEIILLGSLLMLLTTVVHAATMSFLLWQLRVTHAERWAPSSPWTRVGLVCAAVLLLFFSSLVEMSIWGATYLAVGAITALDEALYFSMVTFTSLGYGDVVLPPSWRFLSSFEAANGIILFGWSTALIFLIVQHLYLPSKHA